MCVPAAAARTRIINAFLSDSSITAGTYTVHTPALSFYNKADKQHLHECVCVCRVFAEAREEEEANLFPFPFCYPSTLRMLAVKIRALFNGTRRQEERRREMTRAGIRQTGEPHLMKGDPRTHTHALLARLFFMTAIIMIS